MCNYLRGKKEKKRKQGEEEIQKRVRECFKYRFNRAASDFLRVKYIIFLQVQVR